MTPLPTIVSYEEQLRGIAPVFLAVHAMYWFYCFICPYLFPVYKKLDSGKQSYWAASMVSTTMSSYVAYKVMSIGWESTPPKYLILDFDHLWADDRAVECCYLICGYFLSDLAVGFYYHDKWPGHIANYIHHIAGIFAFVHLVKWQLGHGMAVTTFMLEMTNGFNNLRWFLDTAKMKESHATLYLVNGIAFTLSFFIVRIVGFTGAGIHYMWTLRDEFFNMHPSYVRLVISTYCIAFSLQYMWFYKLSTGLYKMLTKKKGNKTA